MAQSKERRNKRDSKCGVTPPCSPECGAGADDTSERGAAEPGDNLVWLSVHTRDPQHPHFTDKYDKVRTDTSTAEHEPGDNLV